MGGSRTPLLGSTPPPHPNPSPEPSTRTLDRSVLRDRTLPSHRVPMLRHCERDKRGEWVDPAPPSWVPPLPRTRNHPPGQGFTPSLAAEVQRAQREPTAASASPAQAQLERAQCPPEPSASSSPVQAPCKFVPAHALLTQRTSPAQPEQAPPKPHASPAQASTPRASPAQARRNPCASATPARAQRKPRAS